MDLNVKVEVPFLDKVADYIASGIGGAAGPFLVAWKARKEAEAQRITAQEKAETVRTLAEGHSDALDTVARATADTRELLSGPQTAFQTQITLGEMVNQKIQFQEEKRLANQLSVVRRTIEESGETVVPDHEPDHDWTARFFDYIQDVSSEDMQTLWARVLAGEVQRQRETSLLTLSCLRNLDEKTAALFRTFCSACISVNFTGRTFFDVRVLSLDGNAGSNSLRKYGLSFDNLNVPNEHGLVIPDYNSWYDYRACLGFRDETEFLQLHFQYQGRIWRLNSTIRRELDQELRLSGVALTRAGRELSMVVGLSPMNEYTKDLRTFLESQSLTMTEV